MLTIIALTSVLPTSSNDPAVAARAGGTKSNRSRKKSLIGMRRGSERGKEK
jgi:hypothetical protein